MRRARTYSSLCLKIVLVYVHPFHRNSPFCSQKSQKITENPYFWGLRSFNVIDVDTTKSRSVVLVKTQIYLTRAWNGSGT